MSESRQKESLTSLFNISTGDEIQILTSPFDKGVILNGGKLGSRFAPEVLLYELGKMQKTIHSEKNKIKINSLIEDLPYSPNHKTLHLGGGHDTILSFVQHVMDSAQRPLLLINIDPHADMRTDEMIHSGTPMRQILELYDFPIHLIQIGNKDYANPASSFKEPLYKNPLSTVKRYHSLLDFNQTELINSKQELNNPIIVLSLDCDVLDSNNAVSAPAHEGFSYQEIHSFIGWLKNHVDLKNMGIYEYNPLFDSLNNFHARKIASLMHHYLF